MRLNLPVSQREHPFPRGHTLVSLTDLKGRILHCNPAFIDLSGYTKEELLGQAHNLIRHPDMPEEAFRDMWDSIGAGLPWSGVVKNRRKNGDHYWVQANVTPLTEDGRPIAYLSVRTEPSRAQIDACEALYAEMRAEQARGRLVQVLSRGQVLRRDWRGRLNQATRAWPWIQSWAGYALIGTLGLSLGLLWPQAGALAWVGLALLAAAMAWGVRRKRQAALAPVQAYANKIAAGDLSQRLPPSGNEETAALEVALNQLGVNICAIVADTRHELGLMRAVTAEIATGNQNLSQRTNEQAASLEETAAAMEQITGTVRSSTDIAHQASKVANDLGAVSTRSAEVVHHVTDTMGAISNSSHRIGEIIQVIDSIAFQTNILALNAAVESARAGEHGRGFAVVASEVRALAQRSSTAAREIKQLIQESADRVSAGEQQTRKAQDSIDETLKSVQDFGHLIANIHHSADEQLSGISQVNLAINHMDAITQQNAAMVATLAQSAAEMLAQVQEVHDSVRIFRLDRADRLTGLGGVGDADDSRNSRTLPDAVSLRRQFKNSTTQTKP
ncbi:methyl-accepting chemotaxis protein [Roseateles sp.]|uniref:methyl-accepting chemotaxis protein n=1 Tax=Roseateles sp. TaxID=1971397 RepID=UPI003BA5626B